ncbi:sugar transporter [Corchorus olitorius]|uniref:Sugar transporter n=1 Tax=Corchorus olitorius TaxID=93759 RepID=A0A1R3KBN0_9ROSI|nr:sugar transporter [Corchorus olitorius]
MPLQRLLSIKGTKTTQKPVANPIAMATYQPTSTPSPSPSFLVIGISLFAALQFCGNGGPQSRLPVKLDAGKPNI